RVDLAAALSRQWSWQREAPADDAPHTPLEATAAGDDDVTAAASHNAVSEDGGRLVAELQTRLREAYEQLAAAEARIGALEPAVDDLTKAFGVLNAQLHARAEEFKELRAASAKREEQIAAAARPPLG